MKKDKILHLVAGFIITFIICIISGYINITIWTGIIATILIGAGKEIIYDHYMKKGKPEWLDFVWTVIGGIMGTLLYLILWWWLFF